jgi:hypothetical protein
LTGPATRSSARNQLPAAEPRWQWLKQQRLNRGAVSFFLFSALASGNLAFQLAQTFPAYPNLLLASSRQTREQGNNRDAAGLFLSLPARTTHHRIAPTS